MVSEKKFKVGVIGAGSIGSLFGGYLAFYQSEEFTQEVTFFCRKSHCNAINEFGLTMEKKEDLIRISGITAYDNASTFLEKNKDSQEYFFDYIIVSTKTTDLERALNDYHEIINKSHYIVILQNGIGNEEIVAQYCNKSKIVRIITSHGAFLEKPGKIIHTGEGFVKMGFPFNQNNQSELNFFGSCLTSSGLKTEVVNNIQEFIWEKAFVNIAINPLAALTRLHNGSIIKDLALVKIMKHLIKESLEISRKLGIKLPDKDYFQLAKEVAYGTSDNINSMLQDILRSKPTEIDYLNGKIVEIGKRFNIDTPTNKIITVLIKGLENSRL
jgi:2-dehydropantoate 2-reductase